MELIEYKNHFITYQRQGNDVNGNPVYLVNVFEIYKPDVYENITFSRFRTKYHMDKYGNIRIKSYNIQQEIKEIIDMIGE